MPRFHFQVRTETHVMLSEVVELPKADDARLEASRRVGELLKVHAGKIWEDQDWRMDVTDDVGLILFVLQITAVRSAAMSRFKPGS